ncbi:MAG: arsenate reductase ArsC [Rhodothermales bacterium]|nr:arsenate reductase ArsC [Rhodothermales bacterium]MBO6780597.1 arsenate reductase ArsC [Rhodothermales bacterium]
MAEGLLRARHGERYEALSAGTEATRVKPEAAQALEELGIDASGHYSKTVDDLGDAVPDYVVTVCDAAKEACPYVPARSGRVHRAFADPSDVTESREERMQAFRDSCAEIQDWIDATFGSVPPRF